MNNLSWSFMFKLDPNWDQRPGEKRPGRHGATSPRRAARARRRGR